MASAKGFFTDTTVCIGCKACEVACKQWNQLPDDGFLFTGLSYDNTAGLGSSTWRHVTFLERRTDQAMPQAAPQPAEPSGDRPSARPGGADRPVPLPNRPNPGAEALATALSDVDGDGRPSGQLAWLMMSDVCKHCQRAGCLEACPTGAIVRTEHDSVYVQPDVCNGCGYCVAACPFGVIARREDDGRAWKCTLCYDRLQVGEEPACAKSCPTDSIVFGELDDLRELARQRVQTLHDRGVSSAYLYGEDAESQPGTEGLNAFFLLTDLPERYNLPPDPVVPTKPGNRSWAVAFGAAAGMLAAAALSAWLEPGGAA